MKKQWDERQKQETNQIGALSFVVMFLLCAVVIVVELIWKGSLEIVAGETIVLLGGGITYLSCTLRDGYWVKSEKGLSITQNLLMSIVFAGIFSVIYALVIVKKIGESVMVAKYVAIFFGVIVVLSFICLLIFGKIAQHKNKKQEEKYPDEEE
jgi:predicted neutral ceramidase superfamily lipid hydrolase